MTNDTQQRPASGHRSFLPRRSRGDRKLAGVAGGLGRAFGIDPVLFRVAFVVLAIFGGAGVLLYCAGWLLMARDGDEVSAIEALAGRGHSSVSTPLTIVLIIVGLSGAGSVFSWGFPFWPVVVAAVIVFLLARHGRGRRGSSCGSTDWNRRADEFAERAAAWGARAGQWGSGRTSGGTGWRKDAAPDGYPFDTGGSQASPFQRPPFWERGRHGSTPAADQDDRWGAPDPATRQPGPDQPPAPEGSGPATDHPSPRDLLTAGRRTPPAWDPLGVAPFAWDLPDPTPEPVQTTSGPARGRGALGRMFLGLALVAGGVLAGGVFAGWWTLSWGAVAAITLAVIGFGLLVTSLRGAGGRGLIGPGIFLSLVTLALTVTGISGTTEYGQHTWAPTIITDVDNSYSWNAGQATLDLSGLDLSQAKFGPEKVITAELTVNAGQATIIVPKDVSVEATCSTRVGDVDCLDGSDDGIRPAATGHQSGATELGKLVLQVRANAGQVRVISNG